MRNLSTACCSSWAIFARFWLELEISVMDAVSSCAAAETFCDCPADSLLTFSISRTEVTMCSLPLAISPIAAEIPATWVDTSSVS